jgi:hypothetical protein
MKDNGNKINSMAMELLIFQKRISKDFWSKTRKFHYKDLNRSMLEDGPMVRLKV